jgi:Flp pilus assembly protein TadD
MPGSPLVKAWEHLRQGNLDEAESFCRIAVTADPANPEAIHLLGLIHKEAGRTSEAERLMRLSTDLAPTRADFQANLGNLLRATGKPREAELAYRTALRASARFRPARLGLARLLIDHGHFTAAEEECRAHIAINDKDAEVWSSLGRALQGSGRSTDAISAFRRAIEIHPAYGAARHFLGGLLLQIGEPDAARIEFDAARAAGFTAPELFIGCAKARAELGQLDEAESSLRQGLELHRAHAEMQTALARLRFMRSDPDPFRDLRTACFDAPDDLRLKLALGDLLRRTGDFDAAQELLESLIELSGRRAEVLASLATVMHEKGSYLRSVSLAREAYASRPASEPIAEILAGALLSIGEGEEALTVALRWSSRLPHDQGWIAFEASALRLLGHPRYRSLYDYERFVKVYDLEVPPGWQSIATFNHDLAAAQQRLHSLSTHPLDQSLRFGTQSQRSLLRETNPAIRAFLDQLQRPLEMYRQAIGSGPDHPLSSRNHGIPEIVGCWSVRLQRGGYHVNHTHPAGWISSAYYVEVPPEVADETAQSGWIKFGEPGVPVPGATPERLVQPKPGRLVLFPSYMWHGTTPITGDQPRMTVAFDVIPKPQPR